MKKVKKERYFGIEKVKQGDKLCWLSRHDKNGWSLGLALNKRNVWLKGLRFKDRKEVDRILESSVVFIHLKSDGQQEK